MTSKQLDRLINHNFPWLWAIRPTWGSDHNEIRVVSVRKRLTFLRQQAQPAGAEFEVWCKIRVMGGSAHVESVYRVTDEKPWGGASWREAINFSVTSGFVLDAIVAVDKTRCGCARLTIYRSFKKSSPLTDLM